MQISKILGKILQGCRCRQLGPRLAFSKAMGRPLRIQSSHLHYHVTVTCNAPDFRFESQEDYSLYLETLRLVQKKHRFHLFNFELSPDTVQLFLKPAVKIPLARSMQLLNWKFSRDLNRRKGRTGCFWSGRYRSAVILPGTEALALMRDMNLASVRKNLSKQAGEWPWSAYPVLALGASDDLITPHPSYLGLGGSPELRRIQYEKIVNRTRRGDSNISRRVPADRDARCC